MASRTILAETHVLGSIRGYGTVAASGGVAADESRELESFQFGDASTAERIARLETNAVMTGRALRSGRFAVSRMMPAGFDDAGRPTVEVITLLFEARDLGFVAGALERLASDAEFWRTARATVGDGARVDAEEADAAAAVRDARVLRHFDLWRAALRDGAVGVVSEGESDSVLALFAALDPSDRAQLRFGIGLLSLSAPVDLCSVALGTSLHGARPALRPAEEGAWHCGEESEYAAFRASAGGAHLPSIAEIESQGRTRVVRDEDAWRGRAHGDGASRRTEDGDTRARRLMPLAIGSAALSTVVLAFVLTMWTRRENAAAVEVPVFAPSSSSRGETRGDVGDSLSTALPPPPIDAAPQVEVKADASTQNAEAPSDVSAPTESAEPKQPAAPKVDSDQSEDKKDSADTPTPTPPAADADEGARQQDGSTAGAPSAPSVGLGSEAQINAALQRLKDIPQLRLPSAVELAGLPSEHERGLRINAAHRRAEDAGRAAAEQFLALAALDASLKRDAKQVWEETARETKSHVYAASLNGFICTKSRIGPDQNDELLNRELMKRWLEVLRKIEQIRPSDLAPELTAHWDKGVEGVLEGVSRSDADRHQKSTIGELLRSTAESAFMQERKRVEVVLAKPELTE